MKNLFLLLLFCTTISFSQTNYYVASSGSNSNNGSLATPWKTIQYGLNQLTTNATLNVSSGVYNEKITIKSNAIILKKLGVGNVIIDATGITTQTAVVQIINKSNVLVDGFEIRNNIQNDAQGILISGSGANITIQNCVIHDIHFSANVNAAVNANTNAQGIIVYGTNATTPISNLKIANNQLYNCRLGYSEGIAVNGNVNDFEVSSNSVHDLTNIGIVIIGHEGTCPNAANDQARNGLIKSNTVYNCISPYATCGGLYVDGGKDLIIENNTSYHNGFGIEIGCENIGKTASNIIARQNVFYDNQIAALALGGFEYPAGSGKVVNAVFTNNTCLKNDFANDGNGELYLSYSENCKIENNIFYLSSQNILAFAELNQPQLSFNYNVFYSLGGASNFNADWNGNNYATFTAFKTGTNSNANSVFGNPLLTSINTPSPDFHIASNSPCVNAGNPTFVAGISETDFYGQLRVEDGRVDIGADEFGSNLAIANFGTSSISILVYPNPTNDRVVVISQEEITKIEVYNAIGQKVTLSIQENAIDVSALAKGNYFIHIETTAGKVVKKLIKN